VAPSNLLNKRQGHINFQLPANHTNNTNK
jgi:hypothetical protein